MVGIVDDCLINVFVIKVKKQVGFAVLSAVRAIITQGTRQQTNNYSAL